jgi:hypothetical protein
MKKYHEIMIENLAEVITCIDHPKKTVKVVKGISLLTQAGKYFVAA